MATMTRTWWGTKFMNSLEGFMDEGRLKRGRSYSGEHRVLSFEISNTKITATIRGNKNPYFGVYREPKYKVTLSLNQILKDKWPKIIDRIASNVGLLSKLILNEMPDDIETAAFGDFGITLLPHKSSDLISKCSCPDWENPCKHVAGVYFKIAAMLDADPFLLFQLRGISKDKLQGALRKTPLGKAMSSALEENQLIIPTHSAYFTSPTKTVLEEDLDPIHFWQGSKLPEMPVSEDKGLSAMLIKKHGDNPAFWCRYNSFIEAMESVYDFIRTKNRLRI